MKLHSILWQVTRAIIKKYSPIPDSGYGQHGEDRWVLKKLKEQNLTKLPFLDVGANHPMFLSNTYLLTREGMTGYTFDPNIVMVSLHRVFRSGDTSIVAGAGPECGVANFGISDDHTLSSFATAAELKNKAVTALVSLDEFQGIVKHERYSFLSLDVEGYEPQVLEGSAEILPKIFLICLEANSEDEKAASEKYLLPHGFKMVHSVECNYFYENTRFTH